MAPVDHRHQLPGLVDDLLCMIWYSDRGLYVGVDEELLTGRETVPSGRIGREKTKTPEARSDRTGMKLISVRA